MDQTMDCGITNYQFWSGIMINTTLSQPLPLTQYPNLSLCPQSQIIISLTHHKPVNPHRKERKEDGADEKANHCQRRNNP
jgi:hypothetical protein